MSGSVVRRSFLFCFLPPPLSIFIPDTIYLCLSVRLSTVRRREAVVAEWVRKNTDTDGEGAQINDGCALRYRAEKGPPVIEIEKAKVAGSEALAESIRPKSCRLVSILCVRLRRTGWDKIRRVGILCFCVSCCTAIVPRPSNYFSLRGGAVIYVSVPRGPNSRNDVPSSLPSVLASPFIVFFARAWQVEQRQEGRRSWRVCLPSQRTAAARRRTSSCTFSQCRVSKGR